jgi:hypothetical protein
MSSGGSGGLAGDLAQQQQLVERKKRKAENLSTLAFVAQTPQDGSIAKVVRVGTSIPAPIIDPFIDEDLEPDLPSFTDKQKKIIMTLFKTFTSPELVTACKEFEAENPVFFRKYQDLKRQDMIKNLPPLTDEYRKHFIQSIDETTWSKILYQMRYNSWMITIHQKLLTNKQALDEDQNMIKVCYSNFIIQNFLQKEAKELAKYFYLKELKTRIEELNCKMNVYQEALLLLLKPEYVFDDFIFEEGLLDPENW